MAGAFFVEIANADGELGAAPGPRMEAKATFALKVGLWILPAYLNHGMSPSTRSEHGRNPVP